MATLIRINQAADGTWSVLAKDSNGVWVVADSESHGFATRQEAQDCADGWVSASDCVQLRIYDVFRTENRAEGDCEHVGTVEAIDAEHALDEAHGQFECKATHRLSVELSRETVHQS